MLLISYVERYFSGRDLRRTVHVSQSSNVCFKIKHVDACCFFALFLCVL